MEQVSQTLSSLPPIFFAIVAAGLLACVLVRKAGLPQSMRKIWGYFLLLVLVGFVAVAYFGSRKGTDPILPRDPGPTWTPSASPTARYRGPSIADGRTDCVTLDNGQVHCP